MKTTSFIIASFLLYAGSAFSQANCSAASSGFTPINDLGTGTFTNAWNQTWTGGLYTNGSNYLPPAHKAAGVNIATTQIIPRNATGNSDPVNGRIVWLSIGMSNATQETQQFIPLANAYANKNPQLTLVDGAQSTMTAAVISNPSNPNYNTYWNTVNSRLSTAGVTANQVQVIWLKEADAASVPIQQYYNNLVNEYKAIMHEITNRFPNAKLCYMACRISGRYASTQLNPEPYAYYTGWALRNVIQEQINGDTALAYSGSNPRSPWLCWGIYMWSDGSTPQTTNPNVFWLCPTDFATTDGTHPSTAGAQKVANLLLTFYQNDTISCPWFFNILPAFCGITGIKDESLSQNSFDIFPNPASVNFTLMFYAAENSEMKIDLVNSLGQMVYSEKATVVTGRNLKTINAEIFPSGIYMVRIRDSDKTFHQKIIIQK